MCIINKEALTDCGSMVKSLHMYTSPCCSHESISAVKEWLKALPSEGADAVDCGSLTLDQPQIAAIEKAVYDMQVLTGIFRIITSSLCC